MKRLYLSIWWALLLVLTISAKEVTLEQAKRCAAEFMRTRGVRSDNMFPVFNSIDAYYIFNLQPDGWVIISADDVVMKGKQNIEIELETALLCQVSRG